MIYLFLSAMLVLVMLLQFAETKTQKVSMRLNVTAWILSFLLGIAIYLLTNIVTIIPIVVLITLLMVYRI